MELFIYLSVFLTTITVHCDLTTKYYESLLIQKTTEARVYKLPEKNSEFTSGVKSSKLTDYGYYDFIIVGSGSAGSVLATRLSEIDKWNVLLLEAGDEEDDFNKIPAIYPYLQFSEKNWGYLSTPQKNCCLGMKNRRCMTPRGKSIGGSSAINGLIYSRGSPEDYNKWVEMGNPGWSYEEVLPYFIKSENSQIDGDIHYHGKEGFWNVEYALPPTDQFKNFIEGSAELNKFCIDYNGHHQIGVSKTQINIKHGRRQSSGTAFLDNARKRRNLQIVTKALVTKINIENKVAQGVEFVTADGKFAAHALKEVLISAGAINSPQLLMLSGIGPKEHLTEMNIEVIEDLPVGRNLLDHPLFFGLTFRTNYTYTENNVTKLIEMYLKGLGPLTNPANAEGVGFINTYGDVPMLEYVMVPPALNIVPITEKIYNLNDELTKNYSDKINSATDIFFYVILLHQKSKGRVTLKSKNPIDFPNIDLNLFAEPEDIDQMIAGIDFILKLSKTSAFQKLNSTLLEIPICQEHEKYSRQFFECAIRHMSMTSYHPCGTTAMGPDKRNSVVDTNLKVHGIEKLRVVDAGVFPSTISGHTNAPTIMVAEKISDFIKSYYNNNRFDTFIYDEFVVRRSELTNSDVW